MKKFKWRMAGESFDAVGGSMMRFHCEDFPGVTITRCNFRVPCAYKQGYWIARKYFVEAEDGLSREFRTKRECMDYVESGELARFQKDAVRQEDRRELI